MTLPSPGLVPPIRLFDPDGLPLRKTSVPLAPRSVRPSGVVPIQFDWTTLLSALPANARAWIFAAMTLPAPGWPIRLLSDRSTTDSLLSSTAVPVTLVPHQLPSTRLLSPSRTMLELDTGAPPMTLRSAGVVPPTRFIVPRIWTPKLNDPDGVVPDGSRPRKLPATTLFDPLAIRIRSPAELLMTSPRMTLLDEETVNRSPSAAVPDTWTRRLPLDGESRAAALGLAPGWV